uniref:Uncharacterized protein n=1 Tax=Caudovirales sp. ctIsq18 TaxID=2825762 RepID=A0A8S5PM70_9CAUD|nr:MAG TPA: hypothetical protein [Caudovirales sp. ctIsq18]
MCITDKAKETSSCADLFRCGATSVYLERGGVRSASWRVCLSHPPASMLLLYHMQVVHGVASFI